MTRPARPTGGDLLHCNQERTLLVDRDPAGELVVRKILLRGSITDAEHECELGRRVGHLGVVRYLDARTDAESGRPEVRMHFHPGTDLDALVATRGALPAVEACALLLPAARTLAAMHALRAADLPHGLCHGDVKPGNLLWTGATTLLLDFEHAGATHQRSCAGTLGFAAPEAEVGAPLHPSFDVYGLGAVLRWLLTGTASPRARLSVHDDELQLLVEACRARSPLERPTAAVVAEALAEIGERLRGDAREPARAALLAGELDACRAQLQTTPDPAVARTLAQRARLCARRPALAAAVHATGAGPIEPKALADRLALLGAWTLRFPRATGAVANLHRDKQRAGELLAASLPRIFEYVRAEDFDRARALLDDLRRLTRIAAALPGALRVPGAGVGRMPSLLQRAPLACLDQEGQRLEAAAAEHTDLLATLHAAEGALALDDAANAIDNIGNRYGGTSEAVARYRDRLHRLGFYVERIARGRGNIDRLYELLPGEDPAPLLHFVDECAGAVAASAASADQHGVGAIGLRSLHLALGNLRDEFLSVRERAAPGLACLDRALARVTDEAWGLLADAQQKLQAEPVPVRPLQLLLGRLDTFRSLEAFVDRPQHSRSALIDRIEWLRLRLEQVQATRDRLARGAEQALKKGHWTTGLFDMERAVTHLQADDDHDDRQAALLRQRLADAKKRKQEIDQAQRRQHELASRYAALQDDPHAATLERLQVLREQRDCLQFLAVHANKDRSDLYGRDLRDVELRIAQEQGAQAEAELDNAEAPADRLRIAAQALAQLEGFAGGGEAGVELPGRMQRLLDHWRRRHANELREVERRQAEAAARRRRRWLPAWVAIAFVVLAGTSLKLWPGAAQAAARDPLQAAATELAAPLRTPAATLADAIIAMRAVDGDAATALTAAETRVAAFLLATQAQTGEPARAGFARDAWLHAVHALRAAATPAHAPDFEAAVAAATLRLRTAGMAQ